MCQGAAGVITHAWCTLALETENSYITCCQYSVISYTSQKPDCSYQSGPGQMTWVVIVSASQPWWGMPGVCLGSDTWRVQVQFSPPQQGQSSPLHLRILSPLSFHTHLWLRAVKRGVVKVTKVYTFPVLV